MNNNPISKKERLKQNLEQAKVKQVKGKIETSYQKSSKDIHTGLSASDKAKVKMTKGLNELLTMTPEQLYKKKLSDTQSKLEGLSNSQKNQEQRISLENTLDSLGHLSPIDLYTMQVQTLASGDYYDADWKNNLAQDILSRQGTDNPSLTSVADTYQQMFKEAGIQEQKEAILPTLDEAFKTEPNHNQQEVKQNDVLDNPVITMDDISDDLYW